MVIEHKVEEIVIITFAVGVLKDLIVLEPNLRRVRDLVSGTSALLLTIVGGAAFNASGTVAPSQVLLCVIGA